MSGRFLSAIFLDLQQDLFDIAVAHLQRLVVLELKSPTALNELNPVAIAY